VINDSRQKPLYDVRSFIPNPYSRGSFYDVLERFGALIIHRGDFPEWDGSRGGEEPWCPVLLSKLVLIQQKRGWNDRETVQHATTNLQVKACLGLGVESQGPSQPTLCRHRALMKELGLHEVYHTRFLQLLKTADLLKEDVPVAVDTVPVWGAGQVQDTITLLSRTIRKGLFRLAELLGETREVIAARLGLERHLTRSVKGSAGIDWSKSEEIRGFVDQLVQDAVLLQEAIKSHTKACPQPESGVHEPDEDPDDSQGMQLSLFVHEAGTQTESVSETKEDPDQRVVEELESLCEQLDKVIQHDIEIDQSGQVTGIRQVPAGDRMISSTDPHMRHGRKSSSSLISGYKAQIVAAITYGWILLVKIIPANRHDGADLPYLVERIEEHGQHPLYWVGDHAYGTLDNHQYFKHREHDGQHPMELVARNARPGNGGRFTKDEFVIDFECKELTCPGGHTCSFRWATQAGEKGWSFNFPGEVCSACPLREKCVNPKAKSETGRLVFMVESKERLLRNHLELRTSPEFLERLSTRHVVERTNAFFAQCGGKKARRLNIDNVEFDATLSALCSNLRSLGTVLSANEETLQVLEQLLLERLNIFFFFFLVLRLVAGPSIRFRLSSVYR
jgi:hypothetical protein